MSKSKQSKVVGIGRQIPRNSLMLLMISQALVIVPHVPHLPLWIIAVCLTCGLWRAGVYQGRWDYPKTWIKSLLVIGSVVGVSWGGFRFFSLDVAVALLVVAYALKLIEMKSRRDAYVVSFLGYFVIATQFLFEQSIAMALYEVLVFILVTAAMVGLNQLQTRVRPWQSIRIAALLVAQALPLTVVLFVFFPRVSPFWNVPLPNSGKTGLSDQITPGDIANLSQSDELAFRVEFDGRVPANPDLYWRGLVYEQYANGTWRADKDRGKVRVIQRPAGMDEPGAEYQKLEYEVLAQPTSTQWLYGLDIAYPRSGDVIRTTGYRLQAASPLLSVFRYPVTSLLDAPLRATLSVDRKKQLVALPEADNPQIRRFARTLFDQANGSEDAFAAAVLTAIREQEFYYTLRPPQLARTNAIDEFWFNSRRGFCSHYAGALVFMARSVGIPARMVGGYQGGEVNTLSGHLVVRQYDAHAWAELWSQQQGWVRVDPTFAVAPQRIEQGLNAALSDADRSTLEGLVSARLGGDGLVTSALRWMDSMEHRWNLWVVGYDVNQQEGLLTDLLGELTPAKVALVMASIAGGGLACVGLVLFWRSRRHHRGPLERALFKLSQALSANDLARRRGETAGDYLQRIASAAGDDQRNTQDLVDDVNHFLYNPQSAMTAEDVRRIRGAFRKLQLKFVFSSR